MIKSRCKEVVKEQWEHEFFCDCCGKSLGISEEFDDGYVPKADDVIELRSIRGSVLGVYFSTAHDGGYPIICEECYDKLSRELFNDMKKYSKYFKVNLILT